MDPLAPDTHPCCSYTYASTRWQNSLATAKDDSVKYQRGTKMSHKATQTSGTKPKRRRTSTLLPDLPTSPSWSPQFHFPSFGPLLPGHSRLGPSSALTLLYPRRGESRGSLTLGADVSSGCMAVASTWNTRLCGLLLALDLLYVLCVSFALG